MNGKHPQPTNQEMLETMPLSDFLKHIKNVKKYGNPDNKTRKIMDGVQRRLDAILERVTVDTLTQSTRHKLGVNLQDTSRKYRVFQNQYTTGTQRHEHQKILYQNWYKAYYQVVKQYETKTKKTINQAYNVQKDTQIYWETGKHHIDKRKKKNNKYDDINLLIDVFGSQYVYGLIDHLYSDSTYNQDISLIIQELIKHIPIPNPKPTYSPDNIMHKTNRDADSFYMQI